MTNGEKYKTAHERSEAFRKFCGANTKGSENEAEAISEWNRRV